MNITLEPYTARLFFKGDSVLALNDWGKMISRFMERLTREIEIFLNPKSNISLTPAIA